VLELAPTELDTAACVYAADHEPKLAVPIGTDLEATMAVPIGTDLEARLAVPIGTDLDLSEFLQANSPAPAAAWKEGLRFRTDQ
jgi:hypothetical protein